MRERILRLRPLKGNRELQSGVALQKATWGTDFDDVVSAAIMDVSQKLGGVTAGAFDADERLIGMIFGLTGIRQDTRVHWSHMLAVVSDWQGLGVGMALKAYQRRRALSVGARTMYWTFDPLEARNAHFNLNRLGAEVSEYVRDAYGSGESSPLHRGIGTDRFVAIWQMESARVVDRMRAVDTQLDWDGALLEAAIDVPLKRPQEESAQREEADPHVDSAPEQREDIQSREESTPAPRLDVAPREDSAPAQQEDVHSSAEHASTIVEIPPDIQRLKAEDPEEARNWRRTTRAALMSLLDKGYIVQSFATDRESNRCYYHLQGPSEAAQTKASSTSPTQTRDSRSQPRSPKRP